MGTSLQKSPNWERLVDQFLDSGKSEKAFCLGVGVNPNSFNYQKRKILAAKSQAAGFIPIAQSASEEQPLEMRLELPFGIKLHLRGPAL